MQYQKTIIFLNFILILWIFCFGIFSSALPVFASVNSQINYQGRLSDTSGNPVTDGNYDIVFKIYDAPTGGATLWTGSYTTANGNPATVEDGAFFIMLGSGTGNTLSLDFSGSAYYLGVTVGIDPEMTPRKEIGSLPQAINSKNVISDGYINISGTPTGTGVNQGTEYINPTSAGANNTLLGVAVNGTEKFKIDAEGDMNVVGTITSSGAINGLSIASGTISSGTWNGTIIGTQYGGTGINTASSTGIPTLSSGTWSISSSINTNQGGTGQSSYTVGDMLYASGTTTLSKLAIGGNGQCLTSNGTNPVWGSCGGGIAIGDAVTSATQGSLFFGGVGGIFQQDNANFFWDDTNNRLGIGTSSPNSSFQVAGSLSLNIVSKSSDYTLTSSDHIITGDASAGVVTLTLPTAVGITGREYIIKKTDSSSNTVVIGTTSSQTIDGGLSLNLPNQYQLVKVVSNGANWDIIGGNATVATVPPGDCTHGSETFLYTGANQTFTVPTGCTTITVKAWGGGGGGAYDAYLNAAAGRGGGGGYSTTSSSVTPGNALTVIVGGGGLGADGGLIGSIGGFGGGGNGGNISTTTNAAPGPGGGGYSGVFSSSTLTQGNALIIAGGGAGGAAWNGNPVIGGTGNGGSPTGASYCAGANGFSANVSSGGVGGNNCHGGAGADGSAMQGGNGGTDVGYAGGGGGGGYWGGGGAGGVGAGGGGYGYAPSGTLTAGSTFNAANNTDPDYIAGVGVGGLNNHSGAAANNGGNGLVVISY